MSFADITHPDDVDAESEALDQLVAGERRRYLTEKRCLRADGRLVWVSLSLSPVRDEVGNTLYLISQMQDVTERKRTEAKLAHQAMHDPLTGLPNRTLFTDRMQLAKARLERGGSLALLFCDLDDFKEVNDSFGHEAGDRILIAGRGPAALDSATQRHRVQVRRRRVRAAMRGGRARGGGADRLADRRGLLGAVRDRRQRGLA